MDRRQSGAYHLEIDSARCQSTPLQLLRRLDKPVHMTTCRTYTNILKKQFSLEPNPQMQATDTNWLPWKCQASSILDYDLDQLTEYPPLVSNTVTPTSSNPSNSTNIMQSTATAETKTTVHQPSGYTTELHSLKQEIAQLKTIIVMAVEQITQAITSLINRGHQSPVPWTLTLRTRRNTTKSTRTHLISWLLSKTSSMILLP